MAYYDLYGFFSEAAIPGRETALPPPPATEWPPGQRPNWTGHAWIYLDFPPPDVFRPEPVPENITQSQMRRWLFLNKGVRDADVRAIIDAMPDPEAEIARIEWDYAPVIHRGHPLVASLGVALGLGEIQLDQAFREAEAL